MALPRLDPVYHEAVVQALGKERSEALRGLVEYYSSPSTLCEALLNLGFKIDEMRYTPNSLFVNILAIK